MKTLPIYTYGFDVLRAKTKCINKIDDKMIMLISSLFNTMHKANGIGLAAPQVGLEIALTVIDISKMEENEKIKTAPLTLINPVIKDSYGKVSMEEGCLSIPYLRASVSRPSSIFLEYQDIDMNTHIVELNGFLARVVQHEIDHLNGKLFIDYLDKDVKKQIKIELDKIKKGNIETDYLLAEISKKKFLKNKFKK